MKLDQKQIRLLVNLQGSLEKKEVKFLVFQEDQKYTVTNKLEEALSVNSTIFVITSKNVVALGPVLAETKEDIREQVDMIMSIMQNELIEEHPTDHLGSSKIPLIEHPTYTADLFAVIANELEFDSGEIHMMLTTLEKMLPLYTEYFQKNRKKDVFELSFVAKQILLKMNKSQEEIDKFISLLKEKIDLQPAEIEEQATCVLTNLLFEKMESK